MMTYEKEMMNGDDPIVSTGCRCFYKICPLTVIRKRSKVVPYLMQVLEAEESKSVQSLICLGLSKLMLFGLCTDERVSVQIS